MISIKEKSREKIIQKQELQLSKEYLEVEADFKLTESIVREVLEKNVIARNNDNFLISLVWQRTGYAKIKDNRLLLDIGVGEIRKLPSPSTITRSRRKIQNTEGQLLPTLAEVMIRRRIREECVRTYFGEKSKEYEEWKDCKFGIK